jgi:hypothetical protein
MECVCRGKEQQHAGDAVLDALRLSVHGWGEGERVLQRAPYRARYMEWKNGSSRACSALRKGMQLVYNHQCMCKLHADRSPAVALSSPLQLRKDINSWVAKYRRDEKFSGRPSYG